jgi:hypothetical protein
LGEQLAEIEKEADHSLQLVLDDVEERIQFFFLLPQLFLDRLLTAPLDNEKNDQAGFLQAKGHGPDKEKEFGFQLRRERQALDHISLQFFKAFNSRGLPCGLFPLDFETFG